MRLLVFRISRFITHTFGGMFAISVSMSTNGRTTCGWALVLTSISSRILDDASDKALERPPRGRVN